MEKLFGHIIIKETITYDLTVQFTLKKGYHTETFIVVRNRDGAIRMSKQWVLTTSNVSIR
jgi:hypothetical protein